MQREGGGKIGSVSVVLSKFFKSQDLDPSQFHRMGSTPTCQLGARQALHSQYTRVHTEFVQQTPFSSINSKKMGYSQMNANFEKKIEFSRLNPNFPPNLGSAGSTPIF